MNIYLLTQNTVRGYDTFDSCVVIAKDEESARRIHPYSEIFDIICDSSGDFYMIYINGDKSRTDTWPERVGDVRVTLLGKAVKGSIEDVVCSSFNAG